MTHSMLHNTYTNMQLYNNTRISGRVKKKKRFIEKTEDSVVCEMFQQVTNKLFNKTFHQKENVVSSKKGTRVLIF